jgi:hypothetical protein
MVCPNCCDSELEPIYQIQFLVKDKSIEHMKDSVKVLLYTVGGYGEHFFSDILPFNIYKDKT